MNQWEVSANDRNWQCLSHSCWQWIICILSCILMGVLFCFMNGGVYCAMPSVHCLLNSRQRNFDIFSILTGRFRRLEIGCLIFGFVSGRSPAPTSERRHELFRKHVLSGCFKPIITHRCRIEFQFSRQLYNIFIIWLLVPTIRWIHLGKMELGETENIFSLAVLSNNHTRVHYFHTVFR